MFIIVVLLLTSSVATSTYEPLRIHVISAFGPLPLPIQDSLIESLESLSTSISVLKDSSRIEWSEIIDATSEYKQISWIYALSGQFEENLHVNGKRIDEFLNAADFLIVMQRNSRACGKDSTLLASAKPYFDGGQHKRPRIGLMNVCVDSPIWKEFRAHVDLFRHEILHALGFGTFYAGDSDKRGPPKEKHAWQTERGVKVLRNRTFLDFSSSALKEASKHFGCPKLKGIEAENDKKIHLNEYVYGNELMTPRLSNTKNFFTFISASILEETFFGAKQWYMVNRTAILAEQTAYWYGKGGGCKFAQGSCHEFIRHREKASQTTFPFCSRVINNCINRDGYEERLSTYCRKNHINKAIATAVSDDSAYRSCPFDEDFLNDSLPPKFKATVCT
ncbi:unnamed protein product [Caenorhabditis auriculariae]|uniref:Leishmanolysin-like peptidase n=1 Tax=Caenorhabditis auriculariae TaxID=2777116 RepID=A0A8S1HP42_9PELO|nr:unnamed protein product [Caenorhabditis auriculariae]